MRPIEDTSLPSGRAETPIDEDSMEVSHSERLPSGSADGPVSSSDVHDFWSLYAEQ